MSQRDTLVEAVKRVVDILESKPQDVSGTIYLTTQQPLKELVEPLWHYHRGRFPHLRHVALLFAAGGPLEQVATRNGWRSPFERSQAAVLKSFQALNRVRYFGSEDPVELGDRVSLRVMFRRRIGRVAYLPGVSPENPEIDFGGIFRVGIDCPGFFVSCHVDPDFLELKKGITLVARDPLDVPPVPPDDAFNA
ncbi:hypothetical protein [Ahniella affigens]|nr:hypothetical protein [Ahniella affigens]